jgi:hypothetical protein
VGKAWVPKRMLWHASLAGSSENIRPVVAIICEELSDGHIFCFLHFYDFARGSFFSSYLFYFSKGRKL